MPRKPIDYSKCCFYRLVCKDVTVKEVYVGHTTNEVDRRREHKSRCTNNNDIQYNLFVYRFIREHGGWYNWQLLVHEKIAVKDDIEARLRERYWCEFYNATLNRNVPGRSKKEYNAKYQVDHREEIKKYHTEHREEINKRSAAWNLANSANQKEKHDCPCGGKYTTNGRCQHLKTKKHLKYVATQ